MTFLKTKNLIEFEIFDQTFSLSIYNYVKNNLKMILITLSHIL